MNHSSNIHLKSYGTLGHPILVFIHGWPDSADLWAEQIKFFAPRYYCIAITLPNFPGAGSSQWGADFGPLTDAIADSLQPHLRKGHSSDVTVIGHDWGAILSYHLEQRHSNIFQRLITLDVGAHVKPNSTGQLLFFVSYQWWLALAFLIGHLIPALGNGMTALFSSYVNAPRGKNVSSKMNYLYFYTWRAILFKKYRTSLLQRYRPTKPSLFLYGKRNKYYFFSPRWLDLVNATPGGRVEGMAKSDHWINIREPDRTNEIIDEWLTKTSQTSGAVVQLV